MTSENKATFVQRITNDNFIVRDHRVHDVRTLPGVTLLDMIYRLYFKHFGERAIELRKVVFIQPIVTTEHFFQSVYVSFASQGDKFLVTVKSQRVAGDIPLDEQLATNLHCELVVLTSTVQTENFEVAKFIENSERQWMMDDIYGLTRGSNIHHFHFMKNKGTVYQIGDEELMSLQLSEAAEPYRHKFVAHPALLDGSTLAGLSFNLLDKKDSMIGDGTPYVPFMIERFRIHNHLPSKIFTFSKKRLVGQQSAPKTPDLITTDISLYDATGCLLVEFERLTAKRIRQPHLIKNLTQVQNSYRERSSEKSLSQFSVMVVDNSSPARSEKSSMSEEKKLRPQITNYLATAIASLLENSSSTFDKSAGFYELGLNSTHLLDLVKQIETTFKVSLYPTLMFEHDSIEKITEYLIENYESNFQEYFLAHHQPASDTEEYGTSSTWNGELMHDAEPENLSLAAVIKTFLQTEIAALLGKGCEEIALDSEFYDLGLGSSQLLDLVKKLESTIGEQLYPTLLFEHTTIASLSNFLLQNYDKSFARNTASIPVVMTKAEMTQSFAGKAVSTLCFELQWRRVSMDDLPFLSKEKRGRTQRLVILVGQQNLFSVTANRNADKIVALELDHVELPDQFATILIKLYEILQAQLKQLGRDHLFVQLVLPSLQQAGDDKTCFRALAGCLKSMRIENPAISGQVIQLDQRSIISNEDLINLITREAECYFRRAPGIIEEIWYQGPRQHRYIKGLVERSNFNAIESSRESAPRYDTNGIYVITGGLGGLGLLIAEHIVAHAATTLVLLGRSPLDDEKKRRLDAFRRKGAQVLYRQCDISNRADVNATFAHVRHLLPGRPIRGVIHSAGIVKDQFLLKKNLADVKTVLAPKVDGIWHLDAATVNDALDFFVVFSSVSSVFGNMAQSDYAAANQFLDEFTLNRQYRVEVGQRKGKSITINWPLWANGGMSIDEKLEKILATTTGMKSLPSDHGVNIFEHLLSSEQTQSVVIYGELNRLRDHVRPYRFAEQPLNKRSQTIEEGNGLTSFEATDIAIIGVSGRYPMANNIGELKANLMAGKDCITSIPDRWKNHSLGYEVEDYYQYGGFIDDIDKFDPLFFKISPTSADTMDPQARLFIQTAWEACEDAGFVPEREKDYFSGSSDCSVGVFAGVFWNHYEMFGAEGAQRGEGTSFGTSSASIANMVSYCLNLHGPSVALDTMCSSSLTALHLACESIRHGECSYAIAGGVNLLSHPHKLLFLKKANLLASDGRCHSFGQGGDGYVPGEGVGAVLLTTLEQAEKKGYPIYGVIKGSAINHSGKTSGVGVPDPVAQAEVVKQALYNAGVDPRTITYVEAQGTGTALGDPIEVLGLTRAFSHFTKELQYCAIGSSKSMIGHLEAASGIVALTKLLLQFQQKEIFPSLHADQLNQFIPFEQTPFYVQRERCEWNVQNLESSLGYSIPRRALLNAYGANGANAAVIVEEYRAAERSADSEMVRDADPFIIPLSARTEDQLKRYAKKLLGYLQECQLSHSTTAHPTVGNDSSINLRNLSYTLQVGRVALKHRLVFVVRDINELQLKLGGYINGEISDHLAFCHSGRQEGNVTLENRNLDIGEYDGVTATSSQLRQLVDNFKEGVSAQQSAEQIARAWLKGIVIDWPALHKGGTVKRISLPTYPFARDRYWVPDVGTNELESEKLRDLNNTLLHNNVGTSEFHLSESNSNNDDEVETSFTEVEADEAYLQEKLENEFKASISKLLKVKIEELDSHESLDEYGFDSILLTELAGQLNNAYGLEISPTLFFDLTSIHQIAQHLVTQYPALFARRFGTNKVKQPSASPQCARLYSTGQHAGKKAQIVVSKASAGDSRSREPLAIVGMSGCFPLAEDISAFWKNLSEERDCISEVPVNRWDWRQYYGDPTKEENKTNIKWGGFIDGVDEFDPLFFGISPREAELMDPQQRLLMTYIWKAIEDAGYSGQSLAGTRTGIFVGTGTEGYAKLIERANVAIQGFSSMGSVPSIGPNRMSFFLDLSGPSEPIETACSSSLVAIHRACEAIASGSCDMALVGGVNTIVTPDFHISFSKAGMLSEDGRCKTFSDQANGYVRSEGVGMLFIKRLSAAERDGDHIYGLIRGSAENHGGRAKSLTAPNPKAQAALLETAYRQAGVDPNHVSYIETHGTGTALGDPIEINGLKAAFKSLKGKMSEKGQIVPHCALGSVKSNIGHLELAAGIAGVIKVLLQMKHQHLVKSLHSDVINPHIDLQDSPFYILQEARDWIACHDENGKPLPRIAGISSFGFGGVNAHVIIEEYQSHERRHVPTDSLRSAVILLSSKTEAQLRQQAEQLLLALKSSHQFTSLVDIAYTLQVGRDHMEERLAFVASSVAEVTEKLASYLVQNIEFTDYHRGTVGKDKTIVQLFSADDELQEAVDNWIEKKKYHRLLDIWVKGLTIDWQRLYADRIPSKVSLPGYAFARECYWVPSHVNGRVERTAPSSLHPLLHRNTSTLSQQRFVSHFTGQEFFLSDHKINGNPVLPGVAYLELVRAAIQHSLDEADNQMCVILRNIVWANPVSLDNDAGIDIHVRLDLDENEEIDFEIYSKAPERTDMVSHALGHAYVNTAPKLQPTLNIQSLLSQCASSIPAEYCYRVFSEKGFDYGPAQQGLKEIHVGNGQVLARLKLPSAVSSTLHDYVLHPSLLDSALQASVILILQSQDLEHLPEINPHMPFALEEMEILGPCGEQMWAFLSYSKGSRVNERFHKFDIDLCDDSGLICVRLKSYSAREISDRHMRDARSNWLAEKNAEFDTKGVLDILMRVAEENLSKDRFKELIIEKLVG